MPKKILGWFLAVIVLLGVGLRIFWPENLAVKGPVLDFITGRQIEAPTAEVIKARLQLPAGFRIGIFARDINNARSLATTKTGDMLVTSMRPGDIILLHRDEDGDGASDGRTVIASGLERPHGIALHGGYLYIAETTRIVRGAFDADARTLGPLETIFEGMPEAGGHNTRTIGFGPDDRLYVTVGSSCNVCLEKEAYRASMLQMNPDGSDARIHATGLRNSVGFDWHPATGTLYATDNGRDLLGDNTPQCELNLVESGADYGWPWAYGDQQPDPDFGADNQDKVIASRPLVHGFGAHRAPLGIRFFDPVTAPSGYEGAALVALHGSWNRSTLAGYKVVSLHFDAFGRVEQRDFLTGFELEEDVIGRPVEMAFGPDGGIYISDDYAGVIYKVGFDDIIIPGFDVGDTQGLSPLAAYDGDAITQLAAKGSRLFDENGCTSCHDPAVAAENIQVKQLSNLPARYDVSDLAALFAAPPGLMPVFEFTDPDAEALAVYLLTEFGDE